jgi:CRISPR-associated endoribonuclease Cas2 subtype I-E
LVHRIKARLPGVYLSDLKNATAIEVADYLFSHCSESSGLMFFISKREAPGYEIRTKGVCGDQLIELSGLQLVKR